MATRRPLIAGNWKLNGTRESAVALARAVIDGLGTDQSGNTAGNTAEILLCPTALHLPDVLSAAADSTVCIGAQNCSSEISGAFTGEISARMLREFGVDYILAGHSERRALFGESSELVAGKCLAVQEAGVTPILCVGETLEQREAGQMEQVLHEQLDALLSTGGISAFTNLVVAYEPVWAIGTGKTASPEQAQEVHAFIRQKIARKDTGIGASLRILYGGSVKPDNAATLLAQPDVDGGLIGGAALDANSFLAICAAAA